MANILIATLGESPIVVSATVKALKEEHNIQIDQLYVIYAEQATYGNYAYNLIQNAVQSFLPNIIVSSVPIPGEDINTSELSMYFLQIVTHLFRELGAFSQNEHNIYVSIAGGRKNMSALMLYPCEFSRSVRGMYHLLDNYEGTAQANYYSLEDLLRMPAISQIQKMLPPSDNVSLINIPFPTFPNAEGFLKIIDHPEFIIEDEDAHLDNLLTPSGTLIIPMGESPAIVSQTCRLLEKQEKQVKKVIIVYPGESQKIQNAIRWLQEGYRKHANHISFQPAPIKGVEDLYSGEDNIAFRNRLFEIINTERVQAPETNLWLSISGGRKTMAVYSLLVAQEAGIPTIYHTLVNDQELAKQFASTGKIENLQNLAPRQRMRFLFREEREMDKFSLIRIPIILFDDDKRKGGEQSLRIYGQPDKRERKTEDQFLSYLKTRVQANEVYEQGRYEEAKFLYLKALDFIKHDEEKTQQTLKTICDIGLTFVRKRDFSAAIKTYQDILTIAPDYMLAKKDEALVSLLKQVNSFKKEEYRQVLRLLTDNPYISDESERYKNILLQEMCRIGDQCYDPENPATRMKAIIAYKHALEIDRNYKEAQSKLIKIEPKDSINKHVF